MPQVVMTEGAAEELRRLILTHSLPSTTPQRVARSLRALYEFPLIGALLPTRGSTYRFLLGPWRWMILVYEVIDDDLVAVVSIQDARSSSAVAGSR